MHVNNVNRELVRTGSNGQDQDHGNFNKMKSEEQGCKREE
jgi:hypothetical protein